MRRQIVTIARPPLPAFHDRGPLASSPPRVIVLTSARTYSVGFDVAALLCKLGAELIGVPSSQTGNCFIDTLRFMLDHSGLKGRISHKLSLLFPDDPAAGHLLQPSIELTWERLSALDFDPQATVRLALEVASESSSRTTFRGVHDLKRNLSVVDER